MYYNQKGMLNNFLIAVGLHITDMNMELIGSSMIHIEKFCMIWTDMAT